MLHCILCAFATELDDAVVARGDGRCICLRCFTRETDSHKRMDPELRRALRATLTGSE